MLHDRLCCFISITFIVLMFGMLTCCSYVQLLSQINVFVAKLREIANPPSPPPPLLDHFVEGLKCAEHK